MNTTADRMKPEDLDAWLEAAGLKGVRGWPRRVLEILGVDQKRWQRMRAGETVIPRYLGLAMAAHLAGLAPWPAHPGTEPPAVSRPARAKPAPQGLQPGAIYQRRGGKVVEVGVLVASE